MGKHRAAGHAQGGDRGVHGAQVPEAVRIDRAVAVAGDVEQVGVVAGRQRPDEPDPGLLDQVVVVGRVLPGVVDHGQRLHTVDQQPVAGDQLVQHGAELGDVGAVAGVGVRDDRDPTVAGHDQRQTDQAQVHPLLLGLAALGDRGPVVGGVDVGGEVRHVQGHAGQVQAVPVDHATVDLRLDRGQVRLAQQVHRVPEPAVVQRGLVQLHPPRPGRGGPPVREGPLRTRVHQAVERGQRHIRAHRRPRVGVAGHHIVDQPDHVQIGQHRPHRGHVPEPLMLTAYRHTRRGPGQFRDHLGRRAQVLLGHDPWLAVDPGGLDQVVVGLSTLALPHDRRHF